MRNLENRDRSLVIKWISSVVSSQIKGTLIIKSSSRIMQTGGGIVAKCLISRRNIRELYVREKVNIFWKI